MNEAYKPDALRDLIQSHNKDWDWVISVYDVLPMCRFHYHGPIKRLDGRSYISISLAKVGAEKSYSFPEIANTARDQFSGLAVYVTVPSLGDPPDIDIRFGAVWSYILNGHLGGSEEMIKDAREAISFNSRDPQSVLSCEGDMLSVSKVYSNMIPEPVFHSMMAEIISWKAEAQPECYIYQRFNKIMKTYVMISLGVTFEQEEGLALLDQLSWYVPPFLLLGFRQDFENR